LERRVLPACAQPAQRLLARSMRFQVDGLVVLMGGTRTATADTEVSRRAFRELPVEFALMTGGPTPTPWPRLGSR
jgi:hypothetical protein